MSASAAPVPVVVVLVACLLPSTADAWLVPAGLTLITDMTANGQIDEGEGFSAQFCVRNPESMPTPPLLGTLLDSGGVTASDPAVVSTAWYVATFGSLAPGETICRTFSFRVTATCGTPAVASVRFDTVAPTVEFTTVPFPLPSRPPVMAQSFDLVTAPTLPSGWSSSTALGAVGWSTDAASSDTPPNTAFVPGSNGLDTSLVSPAITLLGGTSILTFRNFFNIEGFFDGAVLEISVGGGPFQDVVAAGGVFLAGGYNTSSTIAGPLSGRAAWSGNSGGFLTTQVRLPAGTANQSVRLRWRYGTDGSVPGVGWRIDTITIESQNCAALPTTAPWGLRATVLGNQVSFQWRRPLSAPNATYRLEASLDGGNVYQLALPMGAATSFTTVAPDVVAVVRIRALLAGGALGPTSAPVTVSLGSTSPPSRPRQLLATTNGSALNLAWALEEPGGRASAVVLEAGDAPALANLARLTLPPGTTTFAVGGVPPGTYYLRVRQVGPTSASAPSHEIAVTVPGTCAVPAQPFYATGERAGSITHLWWELGAVGTPAPTSWRLVATDRITDVFLGEVVVSQRSIRAALPRGRYRVAVYALNACGASPTAANVTFDIP